MTLRRGPAATILTITLAVLLANPISGQQADRGLAVRQVRSGSALDGRGKQWAVIIGVSSYLNLQPSDQLKFAHRDAEDLAAFLRSPNGGGFPSTQIKLLLNEAATLANIRTALGTWLPRSCEPDDVVYLFFAGHGVVEGERDGYLLAYDSDPQNLYATALPVAEMDRVLTERLRARVVVMMVDACHSGQIGWASRGVEEHVLINRYLDEIGKSAKGIFRLLASRADERSYEDRKWGGGHGAFTYYVLEGLKGKADRDGDGVVRATELLDYVTGVVPVETQALQHPRATGSMDSQLPLAIVSGGHASVETNVAIQPGSASLELRGTPGSEVYLNNSYRGKIRPSGVLVIEGLDRGRHDLSVDPPAAEPFTQIVSLAAAKTILDLKPMQPERAATRSTPLVGQIRQAISRGAVLEDGGAWSIFQRLTREAPDEPQRMAVEVALSNALEEIGQRAINDYVHAPVFQLKRDLFRRAAEALAYLRSLRAGDTQLEAKLLFCQGRTLIDDGKHKDAVALLKKSTSIDPRAGHTYNALGSAYQAIGENEKAADAFERAAGLAPQWALPRIHLAVHYYMVRGEKDKGEREFSKAEQLDPRYRYQRWLILARLYLQNGRYGEAEKEAVELTRRAPDYAPGFEALGLIYEATRQYAKAADAFERLSRLIPNSPAGNEVRARAAKNRELAEKQQPRLKR